MIYYFRRIDNTCAANNCELAILLCSFASLNFLSRWCSLFTGEKAIALLVQVLQRYNLNFTFLDFFLKSLYNRIPKELRIVCLANRLFWQRRGEQSIFCSNVATIWCFTFITGAILLASIQARTQHWQC